MGLGQINLTNGQVYNYNTGDTIEGKFYTPWNVVNPYSYQTQIILNKLTSIGNDTIFYTMKVILYTSPSTYSISTIIDTVTQLNNIAAQNNHTTCVGAKDSTYTDSCGNPVWAVVYNTPVIGCSGPPNLERTYLVKGAGRFYRYDDMAAYPTIEGHQSFLPTYISKGNIRCGKYVTSIAKIDPQSLSFKLYPNPTTGNFTVTLSSLLKHRLCIYDVNGKLVFDKIVYDNTMVDGNQLPGGIYNVCLMNEQMIINQRLVIVK